MKRHEREQKRKGEVREVVLGDVMFADDTTLLGTPEEMYIAEAIFVQTLQDWEEKVNLGKTEILMVRSDGRAVYDTRRKGESGTVRQLGAWLDESGVTRPDTVKRVTRGYGLARKVAKAWGIGSSQGRGANSGLSISSRLKAMKGTVFPALTTFSRSRSWTEGELKKLQRVANYAVRRAFGMDVLIMYDYRVSDAKMYAAAGWEQVGDNIRRATLQWIGHVACMPTYRRPKQALFGWWADKMPKASSAIKLQSTWNMQVLRDAGIHRLDWFRQAQNRRDWRKTVWKAFPSGGIDKAHEKLIDAWYPGKRLPGEEEEEDEERDGGTVADNAETVQTVNVEEEAQSGEDGAEKVCPVCGHRSTKGNQRSYHYAEEHSIRDPALVTCITHKCADCKRHLARHIQLRTHKCEAKAHKREREQLTVDSWFPVSQGPPLPPPEGWVIATDGSGKAYTNGNYTLKIAGWGVVIFRWPLDPEGAPEFVLHAPVVTQEWNHLWIGAREKTNNTGEVSAIGEAMMWLLNECPDNGQTPVLLRYDSEYAANMAQGIWEPESNEELISTVRGLVDEVQKTRTVTWEHVYSHTGQHDNELADQAADRGTRGEVSAHSARWAAPPPPIPDANAGPLEPCRRCGEMLPTKTMRHHMKMCKAVNPDVPEGFAQCRKGCGSLIDVSRDGALRFSHEKKCRGSKLANRTCSKCGKVYPEPPDGHISKAMKVHESRCTAASGSGSGEPPPGSALGAPKARAGPKAMTARPMPKSRSAPARRAVRKAKAAPKPKAAAKVKAKAKSKPAGRIRLSMR